MKQQKSPSLSRLNRQPLQRMMGESLNQLDPQYPQNPNRLKATEMMNWAINSPLAETYQTEERDYLAERLGLLEREPPLELHREMSSWTQMVESLTIKAPMERAQESLYLLETILEERGQYPSQY